MSSAGRNALAGDISDDDHQPLALLGIGIERIVIITGHGILRTRRESDVRACELPAAARAPSQV